MKKSILLNSNFNELSYKEFKSLIKLHLDITIFISAFDYMHQLPHLHIDKNDQNAILDLINLEFIESPVKEKDKFEIVKEILGKSPKLVEKLISLFCEKNPTLSYCKNKNTTN